MIAEDEARYSRQMKLDCIGEAGQEKIMRSRALVIGMGGLGSPASLYLAAAGIGQLTLCDFDVVEVSNLQRQIIHRHDSVGELKVNSAKKTLQALNPDCHVGVIDHELDEQELREQITAADIVLDCCDNFQTRFAVNRNCVDTHTPLVTAAAIRMEGQILDYIPHSDGPCYQCLYSGDYENAQTCEVEGVLGPVVGVMGTMQALHTLLILTGNTQQLVGKLLLFDGQNMQWQQVQLPRNPQCPACGSHQTG